jgi:hypothetical protein
MWCRALPLVLVLVLTSVAGAQPAPPPPTNASPYPLYTAPPPKPPGRFALGMGALVGAGGGSRWLYGAYTAELGLLLMHAPLHLRARAFGNLIGGTMESDWTGDFHRYGGGVEARSCRPSGRLCLFADLDLGYQRLTLYDQSDVLQRADRGLLAGTRLGFDAGGFLRFRAAVEIHRMIASDRSFNTGGLALGLALQL